LELKLAEAVQENTELRARLSEKDHEIEILLHEKDTSIVTLEQTVRNL